MEEISIECLNKTEEPNLTANVVKPQIKPINLEDKVAVQNEEIIKLRALLKEENKKNKIQQQSIKTEAKLASIYTKIQEKLECPVCLDVPRSGPVFSCPNGHLVCEKCKRNICPSCRAVMKETKSLLASMLIENIPHKCYLRECHIQLPLDKIVDHEKECNYRLVSCPSCSKQLSISSLLRHSLNDCKEVGRIHKYVKFDNYLTTRRTNTMKMSSGCWKTMLYKGQLANCCLKVSKENNIYEVVVIILGPSEKLEVEIIVHGESDKPNEGPSFRYLGKPCSIDVKEEERRYFGIMFSDGAISNMFGVTDECLAVSFKITTTD